MSTSIEIPLRDTDEVRFGVKFLLKNPVTINFLLGDRVGCKPNAGQRRSSWNFAPRTLPAQLLGQCGCKFNKQNLPENYEKNLISKISSI